MVEVRYDAELPLGLELLEHGINDDVGPCAADSGAAMNKERAARLLKSKILKSLLEFNQRYVLR